MSKHSSKLTPFPVEFLEKADKAAPGWPVTRIHGASDAESDDTLVAKIINASEIYPALRALSYRLAGRGMAAEDVAANLERIMAASVASNPDHGRHEDWLDRRSKIEGLVSSAVVKHQEPD
jgi:hypothetical protein